MSFAIWYNSADLTPLAAGMTRLDLSGADKTLALKIWNGGLKDWTTAPIETGSRAGGDPDCRRIVISATGVSAQNMIDLLRRIALLAGAGFLTDIANDMSCFAQANCDGCREPWP